MPSPAESVRAALHDAAIGLVDREALLELVALAAVAGEHVLIIGPPGTAKSEAVRRVSRALGGSYFEYLLGRFTEPSELFGPVDLQKLREGIVETRTEGMLPEAELAFLDEVFLGSTAILNTLLGLLNERVYRRGHTQVRCPLRVCVGASNGLPEDPALGAFADRFVVRAFVAPIADPLLEDLLEAGWQGRPADAHTASVADLDALAATARAMDPAPIRSDLARCVRQLRSAGIALSDRRVVKLQRLTTAAAALAGRTVPSQADLWPIVYAVPDAGAQAVAREVLRDVLATSENATLAAAAEEASSGPLARATRLVSAATTLLAGTDPDRLLKLEGVAREIDAGFARDQLPDALREVRTRIVAALHDR